MEIADSVAMMASHQVGAIRQYSDRLQQSVQGLEDDVMNGLLRYHELTAILDKVAGAELLGRRRTWRRISSCPTRLSNCWRAESACAMPKPRR